MDVESRFVRGLVDPGNRDSHHCWRAGDARWRSRRSWQRSGWRRRSWIEDENLYSLRVRALGIGNLEGDEVTPYRVEGGGEDDATKTGCRAPGRNGHRRSPVEAFHGDE